MYIFFIFTLLSFIFVDIHPIYSEENLTSEHSDYEQKSFEKFLLPPNHPIQNELQNLFKNQEIFNSCESMKEAGFIFFDHFERDLIVCTHPSLKQYVIKKYLNRVKSAEQLAGYLRRLTGQKEVSAYIKAKKFKHITVPKKYLYELSGNFPGTQEKSYLLIAEKLDLCNEKETNEHYNKISRAVLREFCQMLLKFRGLDSCSLNLPFTKKGKIAFIDLDGWEKDHALFLRKIKRKLSQENQIYVEKVWEKYSKEKGNDLP